MYIFIVYIQSEGGKKLETLIFLSTFINNSYINGSIFMQCPMVLFIKCMGWSQHPFSAIMKICIL